jgi:hypothetical protein
MYKNQITHTIYVANDSDYLSVVPNPTTGNTSNPNRYFVFGLVDADLPGFQQQQFTDR